MKLLHEDVNPASYTRTVEHYGRKEVEIDLDAFARDLAKALNGKVVNNDADSRSWHSIALPGYDGMTIHVSRGYHTGHRRVAVSAHAENIPHSDRPWNDGTGTYKLPEATVSIDRPMSKIAVDITRRVVVPATIPLANIRKYAADRKADRERLAGTVERICAAIPEFHSRDDSSDGFQKRLYGQACLSGLAITVSSGSSADSVHVDRFYTSPDALIEIAAVLRKHAKQQ
jgi:hypothetical protein